jgi:hypothetical protein
MKLVHVKSSCNSSGGAALRLHNAILESGIDSYVLRLHLDVNDTDKDALIAKHLDLINGINNIKQEFTGTI